MRKEMGEGKKKEKIEQKDQRHLSKNTLLKKKRLHSSANGGSETDIAALTVEMEKKNSRFLITHNSVWCRSVGISVWCL